jgi:formylglycine-generating enzyme required for sulfatase activity
MQRGTTKQHMGSGRAPSRLGRWLLTLAVGGAPLMTMTACKLEPRYIQVPVYVDSDASALSDVESTEDGGNERERAGVGQPCGDSGCGPDLECTAGRCAPPGFAFIPAGTFWQGAPAAAAGAFARENEMPQRPVTLTHDYLMAIDPMTDGLWEDAIGPSPSEWKICGPDCPADTINWYDALWATNALSILNGLEPCYRLEECTGIAGSGCEAPSVCPDAFECGVVELVSDDCDGFRLPTEAEYERAARAGDDAYIVGVELLTEELVGVFCRHRGTAGVDWPAAGDCDEGEGRLPCGPAPSTEQVANAWGMRAHIGHTWSWMWDGWDTRAYDQPGLMNPVGRRLDGRRSLRGNGFGGPWQDCRVTVRGRTDATARYGGHGLRVMRRLDPAGPARAVLCEGVTLPGPRCPVLVEDDVGAMPSALCATVGGRVFRVDDERENEYLARTVGGQRPAIDARVQDDAWRAINGATLNYQRTSDIQAAGTLESNVCARLLSDGRWEPGSCEQATVVLCEVVPTSP